MIGRTDSTARARERDLGRRHGSSGRLKLLTLAAMLLVFAGIALADHAEKNKVASSESIFYTSENNGRRESVSKVNDSEQVFAPSTYLDTRANFYDNELQTSEISSSSASDKVAATKPAPLMGAGAGVGLGVGAGAAASKLASKSTEPRFKDSSSLRTPEQHRRISRKRQKLYRKSGPVLARKNLLPRYTYVEEPGIAFETRTIRSYATVYPRYRKRSSVLGTAGKIITAPVKLLLSPFKKREYYD